MIWVEICERYPNEWTLLVETDDEDDGRLKSGRVFDHDRSVLALLDRAGIVAGGTDPHRRPPAVRDAHVSSSPSSRICCS
jgi:hypothetical protein